MAITTRKQKSQKSPWKQRKNRTEQKQEMQATKVSGRKVIKKEQKCKPGKEEETRTGDKKGEI